MPHLGSVIVLSAIALGNGKVPSQRSLRIMTFADRSVMGFMAMLSMMTVM